MRSALATIIGGALVATPLIGVASSASASVDGTGVVINEIYTKGGSLNAPYNHKFVELFNPGAADVSLAGWSLQYRATSGTGAPNGVAPLSGTIAAGGYFLVQIDGNGAVGANLPAPDLDVASQITPKGSDGTIYLADTASPITLAVGDAAGTADVIDLVGYGSNTWEGSVAPALGANSVPVSLTRTGAADTDVNSADFSVATTVTPQGSGGSPTTPEEHTIAELQGTGDTSPFAITPAPTVTTDGVVTATYADGGFDGYYVQTPAPAVRSIWRHTPHRTASSSTHPAPWHPSPWATTCR